jgi:hypothetical protein
VSARHDHPEFDAWRWNEYWIPLESVIEFKRGVYVDDTLVEIYVSPVATNKYFIDTTSLTPGKDGVVRYVMVVRTSGGATNVSFEGIHCAERKWKHYASGRSDKTWSKSQVGRQEWRQIENKPLNPVHAILSRTLFCPMGSPIRDADEGRQALRLGKHPAVN